MVVLFGYTSDQKAIGIAKDQLKRICWRCACIAIRFRCDGIVWQDSARTVDTEARVQAATLCHRPDHFADGADGSLSGADADSCQRAVSSDVHFSSSDALNDATLACIGDRDDALRCTLRRTIDCLAIGRTRDEATNEHNAVDRAWRRSFAWGRLPRISTVRLRGQFWNSCFLFGGTFATGKCFDRVHFDYYQIATSRLRLWNELDLAVFHFVDGRRIIFKNCWDSDMKGLWSARPTRVVLVALVFLPALAHAYAGPGAGFAVLSSFGRSLSRFFIRSMRDDLAVPAAGSIFAAANAYGRAKFERV